MVWGVIPDVENSTLKYQEPAKARCAEGSNGTSTWLLQDYGQMVMEEKIEFVSPTSKFRRTHDSIR